MSHWSPLRWTTPLAPRAAPGNWINTCGRLVPADALASRSWLSTRSPPLARVILAAVMVTDPRLFAWMSSATVAPALDRSMCRSADPLGATAVMVYVPTDRAPKEKGPASSVAVRWTMLLPAIETATPAAGLPLSVTVPVTKVVDAAVAAAAQAANAALTAQTKRTIVRIENSPSQKVGKIRLGERAVVG